MQIGLLGLGKMGKILVTRMLSEGHEVTAWNRSPEALDATRIEKKAEIEANKLHLVSSLDDIHTTLTAPRVIWSMLPNGEATNTMLQNLLEKSEPGDIIIDGGNSHFKDTEKWAGEFEKKGIKFLGLGISGGVHAIENGFCVMAGGDESAYEYCKPLFESLIKPHGAYSYFGRGGAGHFVKMVHNGIEYGMMQAIGEGFGVLEKSEYQLDLSKVAKTWQGGSIIESFLLDMASDALTHDPGLGNTSGIINANGEGKWTVEQAQEMKLPVPVIEDSLKFRDQSQTDTTIQETFAAKMVAALRKEFGGHALGKSSK